MSEKRNEALVRRTEWPSFSALQTEMNRLFGDFWGGVPAKTPFGEMANWLPTVELRESARFIDVTAELPGVPADEIKVELSHDGMAMTVSGEKKVETERKDENVYYAERSYGSFRRTIPLPAAVADDSIEATTENGILRLHMAKLPAKEKKTIKVKGS